MKADPGAFLRGAASEQWQVSWSDCVGVVARWLEIVGHANATYLLPPAGDMDAARAHLERCGNLEGAMNEGMRRLGLKQVLEPRKGDVACLLLADGGLTAAIWLGSCWGARTLAGIGLIRSRCVSRSVIWSVGYGR